MSPELMAILLTALIQSAILLGIGVMISRMSTKQIADDAALFLQSKRIEEISREALELLKK